jgi:circadian clock protein KaiC
VREFVLSDNGIDLVDAYLGANCMLTGTARVAQENQELAAAELRRQDHERKLRRLASKQKAIEAQIAALKAEGEAEAAEMNFAIAQETLQEKAAQQTTYAMAQLRGGAKTDNDRNKRNR